MLGSELHLGPDFLADEFTLLECNITKSPHYVFVNAFLQGKKVEETEYVNRLYYAIISRSKIRKNKSW